MKTIPPIEPTLSEVLTDIGTKIEALNGEVSDLRNHAINSQLRAVLRDLGYRPRETREKKATITDLHDQIKICLADLKGEVPEDMSENILAHAKSVLSNLVAETKDGARPGLKEVPQA